MDFDLLSACVFCAHTLFVQDMRPTPGFTGEIMGGYATLQRRERDSESDATMKFVAAGIRFVPDGALGPPGETPATEFRVRLVFPNAHTEASENLSLPHYILATGDGRYENFNVLARVRLAPKLSAEGGFVHRRYKGTDLVNQSDALFVASEQRQLVAERDDYAVGARWRADGAEAALRASYSVVTAKFNTASVFLNGKDGLWGAGADGRLVRGPWSATLAADAVTGTMGRFQQFYPAFDPHEDEGRAWFASARLAVSRLLGEWEALAAVSWEASRIPFVVLAPLGSETRAFEAGARPDARRHAVRLDLAVRGQVALGFVPGLFFRTEWGWESIGLSAAGVPDVTREVETGGIFPFRQFVLGVSADFGVGRTR